MAREVERTNRPCECGAKLYGYKDQQNSRIYLCYKCGKYKGKNVGIFGDFGVWSFDPLKVMTMSDGGLIYSKSKDDMVKLKEQRYLGLKSSTGFSNKIDKKWWEFEISTHGRRSIVNDLSSTLGLEQLKKVDKFIERRKEIACFYDESFRILDWLKTPPKFPAYVESSYYFYWIQVEKNRDELANYLKVPITYFYEGYAEYQTPQEPTVITVKEEAI